MKILTTILISLLMAGILFPSDNTEFRATWVITWDLINRYRTADQNKATARQIMDDHVKANMNAVLWQARQSGTAYYESDYEPWGAYAGKKHPGYDPLAYAIEQAHKRGLELHAWFNVFNCASTDPGAPAHEHPEWICTDYYGNPMTSHISLSPGMAEARKYLVNVAMEIVRNYDIDGIHFDYVRWNEYTSSDMQPGLSEEEQLRTWDGQELAEKIVQKHAISRQPLHLRCGSSGQRRRSGRLHHVG